MTANRSDQATRPLVYMLWAVFIFSKSTIYQEEISKLPPYFILQKYIKISTSKLCRFSIHRNCIEEVHQNDVEFSAIEITSNKVHRNDVDFSHIENYIKQVMSKRREFYTHQSYIRKVRRDDLVIRRHFRFDALT